MQSQLYQSPFYTICIIFANFMTQPDTTFFVRDTELTLLPEKAIWIEARSILIIADVHLGKVIHFRSEGIGLPSQAETHSQNTLSLVLDKYLPKEVVFLGDLFHSKINNSFDILKNLLLRYQETKFTLIRGNHDIYSENHYHDLGITVVAEQFIDKLWLTHEPQEHIDSNFFFFFFHIHPGIRISGLAKQSVTLSCFVFYENQGILPAFGYFTGKSIMKADKKSTIFALTEDKVIYIPS